MLDTRRARGIKSLLAGLTWLVMRVPTDLVLIRCNKSEAVPYAISLQLLDFVVISYLCFKVMQHRVHKPWKCPACDGWGRRFFVPGLSTQAKTQLSTCEACKGTGYIWERVQEGEGENL